jgi:transcription antitermination factor NusG
MVLSVIDTPDVLYQQPHWYACYTYGRHEKRVAAGLEQAGIESFLPLCNEERKWSDRSRRVQMPMFPSYVFARFPLGTLGRVLGVPGLATVVRTRGLPTPIPDAEISQVRELVGRAQEHGVEPEVAPVVRKGQRVRIVSGVFEGIEGLILECDGRTHVMLALSVIEQGVKVAVPRANLLLLD